MSCAPPRELAALVSLIFLSGCIDFSVDGYCDERPALCSVSVRELAPKLGPSSGGTLVRVTGIAFEADVSVELDGLPVLDLVRTDSWALQFVTPDHPPGWVDLIVRSAGTTFTVEDAFEYRPPPKAVAVTPQETSAFGGGELLLSGLHFTSDALVRVNGEGAEVLELTEESIRFRAPQSEAGWAEVVVTNDFGQSTLPSAFLYIAPWTQVSGPLPSSQVRRLWIDPEDDARVVALVGRNVFVTANAGSSWTLNAGLIPDGVNDLVRAPSQPARLYAATTAGIARSDDGGETWLQVGPAVEVFAIGVDPQAPDRLLAGGRDVVWLSSDAGATLLAESLPVAGDVEAVALSAAGDDCWWAGVGEALLVRTSVIPWSVLSRPAIGALTRLSWHPSSGLLTAQGQSGAALSQTGGDRWERTWAATPGAIAVATDQELPMILVSLNNTLWRCQVESPTCEQLALSASEGISSVAIAAHNLDVAYAGLTNGHVYRSDIVTW